MAIRWDDLDGQDDEHTWWAALLTERPGGPLGILERLEQGRPAWQAHAACREPDGISWFSLSDVAAARAVCATCPVLAACRDYGKRERAGVWGGRVRGLRTSG